MKTERINLRLDPETNQKMDELAEKHGVSKSWLIRWLITEQHKHSFAETEPCAEQS